MSNENFAVSYNFQEIEKKWQKIWSETSAFTFAQDETKEKKYTFAMCYYPSGRIHMGHVRLYAINDIINRGNRLKGFNVLNVISADAFGLPAENAAIQNKTHPKKWTYQNIDTMNAELQSLGFSFDWSKFFRSCDENYYKYQQEFFIKFYEKGLAYQKESFVNWDPVDKTVLSNEQVSADGRGWRSGALVEKKQMKQWFFKITDYCEELLQDLKELDWTEKIKKMQENWIGKSEGAEIVFKLKNTHQNNQSLSDDNQITVYTTRPETIFGASAVLLSPNHKISKIFASKNKEIECFIAECNTGSVSEAEIAKKDKIGIKLSLLALHPFTGKELSVYIANYVLDYGTGAVMIVPAHDERDADFTKKYNLEILPVIDENGILKNSDFLNKMNISEAKKTVIRQLELNNIGKRKVNYKLRDWCISRQRYWGCPIPMVQCNFCGTVPEKIENLPVKLPDDIVFDGEGNPLEKSKSFVDCPCPKCSKPAKRITDTMDTYVESAWYFLKQISNLQNAPFKKSDALDVMPVDLYLGGPEHATTHMLYARFFMKALRDCGYFGELEQIQKANWGSAFEDLKSCEPFKKFIATGMVCHEAYQDENGNYFYPEEVKISGGIVIHAGTGKALKTISGIKMSKSKKNTIQPSDIVEKYGADVARFFLASDNPIDNDFDWKGTGIESVSKYVKKIFLFFTSNKENFYKSLEKKDMSILSTNVYQFDDKKILKLFSQYLYSFERNEFNVCIAKFREIMNIMFVSASSSIFSSIFLIRDILRAISPIVPHFAEEVLDRLEIVKLEEKYNLNNLFPVVEDKMIAGESTLMPIQVNGKVKIKLEVRENEEEDKIVKLACEKLGFALESVQKIIYVKNKILNIII